MSNRGKNFRRRSEDDTDQPTTATTTAPTTTTRKPPAPKPKLLSFADEEGGGGDEEESPFTRPTKPKKSTSSSLYKSSSTHRITTNKERISSSASTSSSNVQPQAGEYTKERLLELQNNTRTIVSSSRIKTISKNNGKEFDRLDRMDVDDDAENKLGSIGIRGVEEGVEYQSAQNIGGSAGVMKKVLSIPQQATVASQAMRESLQRLKETHGRTISALERNGENMSAALSDIIDLEKSLTLSDDKFVFMQKLQDFISLVCDCLHHKAPYIEQLEEEMQKLHEQRAEAKRMSAVPDDFAHHHTEGESSTDESDSERVTSYKSNREMLLQTSELVFSDADEEFSKLSLVKEKFETWKKLFFSSYRDAYTSLSVPAIFSPYVRLELLKWDPLHEESEFVDMQWHSLLFDYGLREHGGDFEPDDADANLVPGLVEKVALPILHHDIAHCWDVLSTRETRNAISAVNMVLNYVPATSEAFLDLLSAINSRLAYAVANLTVPVVIEAIPDAARIAAYRLGMSVRLLKIICLWKDILAFPILEQLALDELLSGKVLPHVRSITPDIHDAIARTERIVASLYGVWSGSGVRMERRDKLQPLVDHVLTLGKTLEKKHISGVSENETSGLALRLKKMLVDLNEYDKARTFQLEEAL
ncbi:hypothetical protein MKW94_013837 [Papaver nudicaule]|uniref:GCF C-terminal domain-containing protein n=1 Tax=Papaver nudicaule TaxID=74823 RepID=A0AA41VW21_PAPNU|nr:hypothetical protein [Papaver nudicaule]